MKINILRGSLITGALALLCSMLFILPANAAYENCEESALCLYQGAGGTGDKVQLAMDSTDTVTGTGWNDKAVSVYNNSHYWACVYENTHLGGAVETIKPGGKHDLATLGLKVTSHKLAPSQGACFTGYERCPQDSLCIFKEHNGRGGMTSFEGGHREYRETFWANLVRSVVNRTDKTACFFNDIEWSGAWAQPGLPSVTAYSVHAGDSTSLTAPFDLSFQSHRLRAQDADPKTEKECLS